MNPESLVLTMEVGTHNEEKKRCGHASISFFHSVQILDLPLIVIWVMFEQSFTTND
jgi:hypothetical protein